MVFSMFGDVLPTFNVLHILEPLYPALETLKTGVDVFRTFFLRETNIFETMIVLDGIFNASKFLKEYIVYNMSDRNTKSIFIKECHHFYRLGYDDRYIMYSFMTSMYYLCHLLFGSESSFTILYYTHLILFTVPYIQNRFVRLPFVKLFFRDFIETKQIFIKYTISKTLIKLLSSLDENVVSIQNYQMFLLYDCLTIEYIFLFVKNYIFLCFLSVLRKRETTYYYYKAIKLSYYYNTGYLFNVIERGEAVKHLNAMIRKKNWKTLSQIENTNIVYSLISHKVSYIEDWYDIYIYGLKFFSVWSSVCLLKLLNPFMTSIGFLIYILKVLLTNDFTVKTRSKIISIGLFYGCLSLNINDLIVSLLFIKFDMMYYCLTEIFFFIKNKKNIKKVILYYSSKSSGSSEVNGAKK